MAHPRLSSLAEDVPEGDERHRPTVRPRAILAPSRSRARGRGGLMADDRDARIAQLEAEQLRQRDERAGGGAGAADRPGEVLRIIASSSDDRDHVLNAIAAAAMRLTDSDATVIQQVVGDRLYLVARYGYGTDADLGTSDGTTPPSVVGGVPVSRDSIPGRATPRSPLDPCAGRRTRRRDGIPELTADPSGYRKSVTGRDATPS